MQIQPSRSIYILRAVVMIGVLSSMACCTYSFLLYNLPRDIPAIATYGKILSYTLMPIQGIIALFFIAFGIFVFLLTVFSS